MSCEDILLRGGWKYKLPKLCGLVFLVKKDWYSNYFQTLILYLRLGEKQYHSCTGVTESLICLGGMLFTLSFAVVGDSIGIGRL